MIVVIQDANILIDLADVDLLEDFFRLDVEAHTTDFVLHELRQRVDQFVADGQLRVKSFDGDELAELLGFQTQLSRRLSLADSSVLKVAIDQRGLLLTGDETLRKAAQQRNVEVHGSLWVLDRLVAEGVLTALKAARKLKLLMQLNPRLPQAACQQRLADWSAH